MARIRRKALPKGISYYQEGYILGLGVSKDLVALGFDHVTVGHDDLSPIEFFLT